MPYAELHCHSNFSFLDGASEPEELAEEAARLGIETLAITDHDGFYGVVRFAEAAGELGVRTVFGAELVLVCAPRKTASPILKAIICSSSRVTLRGTGASRWPSELRNSPARRRAGRSTTSKNSAIRTTVIG